MIRINLLPIKRKKKPKAIPPYVIYGVLVTIVVAVASGYSFWYLSSMLSTLKKQQSDNEATITELKNKIKEVENFEAQKKTLEERKNIIEQLRKNQSLPVKMLSEMSSVLPNGVWLTSMSVSGMSIGLGGIGFTNEDVVNYVDNLKKSQLFTDINLAGTQKSAVGKVITYQFSLSCKLKES